MLSAVRAMASRVAHDLAHMDTQRLGPEATAEEQDELLAEVLENALEAGKEAVERGPEQLAVLRESGVVDAGAYGLTVIVAGCLAGAARRRPRPQLEHQYAPAALHRPEHESSSFRYCTNFAVTGDEPRRGPLHARCSRASATRCWWWATTARCACTCTPTTPTRAVALFDGRGRGVALRRGRHARAGGRAQRAARRRRRRRRERTTCAVVAVASGRGVKRLYEELGVLVVDGGATMNPSTYELLAGIHAAPGAEVLVLPNSPNVILAAERAARAVREARRAWCPPPRPQEGLAALLAFDPARPGRTPTRRPCASAAEALRIGGVAPAARDDAQGRFTAGDAVGYAGGELVAWGDPAATLAATLDQIADGAELLTCIAGEAAAARPATTSRRACPTASRSSTTRAGSPPGGGCSARSDALRASRPRDDRSRPTHSRTRRAPIPARACSPSRSTAPRRWSGSASRPGAT